MKKPGIKFYVSPTDYKGLSTLGNQVKTLLTENVSLYPVPNPTLVQLTTHLTALEAAIAAWGTRNTRGSMAALVALKAAANDVRNDLYLLAAYVVNTVDNTQNKYVQSAALGASGFPPANVPSKIDVFGPVQKLHTPARKNVVEPNVYLTWRKPLQLLKNVTPKAYYIYKNGVFFRAVTKTSLIVTRSAGTAPDIYEITAVNDLGEGASTSFWIAARGA